MNRKPNMWDWFADIVNGLFDLIYPPNCALCGKISPTEICRKCRSDLIPVGNMVCGTCGNPKTGPYPCPYCLSVEFHFDMARSLYHYEEPLRDAILDFKYHNAQRKGWVLTGLMREGFGESELLKGKFDIIVPVPLTAGKKRKRLYNQSEIFANGLGEGLGIPVLPYLLMKTKETASQTGFDLKGRMGNVQDAFKVTDESLVKNKRVLLVDDIITTGATASECAGALKDAGAMRVVAVSLARGILKDS